MMYFTCFTINRQTAKAYQVNIITDSTVHHTRSGYTKIWVPKSQVQIIEAQCGYQRMIAIPSWLCNKNNIKGLTFSEIYQ